MEYRLHRAFSSLFDGSKYLHRDSSLGDRVAMEFFEDLYTLGRSDKYINNVNSGLTVRNAKNLTHGMKARRGDGTLGESLPGVDPIFDDGFNVARGNIATVEIGVEVKILGKAMIKQIGRVVSDLKSQVDSFRSRGGNPLSIAVVGINSAEHYTGYEGERAYRTDGRKNKHPKQESREAEKRLILEAKPHFDEFVILRFSATNEGKYVFSWTDESESNKDYGASLVRVGRKYTERF